MITDGVRHTIPLEEIRSGGPPKDGIPSIDDPVFAGVEDASFVADSDIVIGLEIDGQARAYPLSILVWHEIVKRRGWRDPGGRDVLPAVATPCRCLSGSLTARPWSLAPPEKLYNSNLLMYDRLTDTYWSQAIGVAVMGHLSGRVLGHRSIR